MAALVLIVTAWIGLGASPAGSPLRHAYFIPVIFAGTRLGGSGGLLTAAAAVILDAPLVLPAVERTGLTAGTVESLVTFGLLLLVGGLSGVRATRATYQQARYETLIATQRVLAAEATLDVAVMRLRGCLMARLAADSLVLVARDDDRLVVAGGGLVAPESPAAQVLTTGRALFVPHVCASSRPRRCVVVPLLAGGVPVGVLALERVGEIHRPERAALERLGAHIGLALENARLASRQRRFTEELAAKVREATRHLEETDRMKSTFLAVASHELRTPLTALQGFTELMSTRDFPAAEMRRLATIVHGETERLTRIVSDFLDFSHVERGLAPALCRARVMVPDALQDAIRLLGRQSRGHRILVECGDTLPDVDADPDALDRILKNLVSNAVKYSPPGSAVRVRAREVAGGVEFSVADEGVGIPAAALPRVFEPYYRAPGAAQAARGSGIGLAVVKSLVDAHGGSIDVESAPTKGTRVTFVLPSVP